MKTTKFYIYYGGFFSDKWEVKWEKNEMRCYHYEHAPENYVVIQYDSRLSEFINALSRVTKYWLKDYFADVCDGTQWEIDIRVGEERFRFSGSNDYPHNFGGFLAATRIFLSDNIFANN